MAIILITLVFFMLEFALHRRRSYLMTEEITAALSERDSLISTLRHEITDKFRERKPGTVESLSRQVQNLTLEMNHVLLKLNTKPKSL